MARQLMDLVSLSLSLSYSLAEPDLLRHFPNETCLPSHINSILNTLVMPSTQNDGTEYKGRKYSISSRCLVE